MLLIAMTKNTNNGKMNSTGISEAVQVLMAVSNFNQHQFSVVVEIFGTTSKLLILQHQGSPLFP